MDGVDDELGVDTAMRFSALRYFYAYTTRQHYLLFTTHPSSLNATNMGDK